MYDTVAKVTEYRSAHGVWAGVSRSAKQLNVIDFHFGKVGLSHTTVD